MSEGVYQGFQDVRTPLSESGTDEFLIAQKLARVRTLMFVKVISVTTHGEVGPPGYVDVQPLVSQVDGAGKTTEHGTIHNIPFIRLAGGGNAVILDPVPGDIGLMGICDRDISSAKASKGISPPGSRRRHNPSDGVYIASMVDGNPAQNVRFSTSGISITSTAAITITAPSGVTIQAPTVAIAANVSITGTLTNNGVPVGSSHRHNGVQPGGGTTGTPQ